MGSRTEAGDTFTVELCADDPLAAIDAGIDLTAELVAGGVRLLGIGEMGIGNTTAASALASVLTGFPPDAVTGLGTGVDSEGHQRKVRVIEQAIAVNAPDRRDPLGVLAAENAQKEPNAAVDHWERMAALDPRAVAPLTRHADAAIRRLAVEALGWTATTSGQLDPLQERLAASEPDESVRTAAWRALLNGLNRRPWAEWRPWLELVKRGAGPDGALVQFLEAGEVTIVRAPSARQISNAAVATPPPMPQIRTHSPSRTAALVTSRRYAVS